MPLDLLWSFKQCCCQDLFRSRDQDLDKMNSSALETMVSRSTCMHPFLILVTEHSLKGCNNLRQSCYRRGTKHAISRSRPILGLETIARPISTSGLETMTESRPWSSGLESRDRDQDLDKMNSSALEPRDHGLEITTLIFAHDISSSIGVTFIGIWSQMLTR